MLKCPPGQQREQRWWPNDCTNRNRIHPFGLEERAIGNYCCCGVGSLLRPGKTLGAAAQLPRQKPWPKICVIQPLGWSYSGPPNKYQDSTSSQCQTSHYPVIGQNDYTVPVISIPHMPGIIASVLFRVIFLFPNIGMPGFSNVDNPGWVTWSYPNINTAIHGSNYAIFRLFSISSLMGCLCSLTDRKRKPMPNVNVCHRADLWINISNIRWIKSTSSVLFFLRAI